MTGQPIPKDAVFLKEGHPVTTSLKVAEVFGKQHKNVLQNIKDLDCSVEFARLNFQLGSYRDANNQHRPMFEMTKDGFTFLVMGFTGPAAARFKEAYIRRFNEMEAALRGIPAPRETVAVDRIELDNLRLRLENAEMKLAMATVKAEPRRRPWRDDEVDSLIALTRQGLTRRAIGERLGRSPESVETKQRELRSKGQL